MNRSIVFQRETLWKDVYRASTNVVAEHFLADGWRVCWLGGTLNPGRLWRLATSRAAAHDYRLMRFYGNWRQGGECLYDGHLFVYHPLLLIPYNRRFLLNRSAIARYAWQLSMPPVKQVLSRQGFAAIDVLFLATTLGGWLQRLVQARVVIHQVVDWYAGLPNVPKTIHQVEREAYHAADHILVTSYTLAQRLMRVFDIPASHVSVMGHGVHLERYDTPLSEPADLKGIPHPRIICLGNHTNLHFPTVQFLAEMNPQWALVFIGPSNEQIDSIARQHANVYLLGPRPSEAVPAYLCHSDVGVILYDVDAHWEFFSVANPMKLYEYGAAGLPVVSNPSLEYEFLDCPILEASTPKEFGRQLTEALANRDELSPAMRAFAERHSWQTKYQQILSIVEELLEKIQ
jgi:glycosyltransferase involved in cell wall biosynthesis